MLNKMIIVLAFSILPLNKILACQLEIVSAQPLQFSWSTNAQSLQRDIVVKRSGPNPNDCRFFHLTFTNGNSGNINRHMQNGSATFTYNVTSDAGLANILRDHPNVSAQAHVIDNQFSGGQNQKTVSFTLHHPAPPYLSTIAQGLFSDAIQLKLYRGKWNAMVGLDASLNMTPSILVPTYTALSLIETGAPFNDADTFQLLDFGTLEQNEQLTFDLAIESNVAYQVKLSSLNDGRMKRVSASDTIDYTIQVGPTPFSLVGSASSPVTVATHTSPTSQGGARHPVTVVIGSIANKTAGVYQDTITVEAVAQ